MAKTPEPTAITGREFRDDDLSLIWGLTTQAVAGFRTAGLLRPNRYGRVDRSAVLRFVNSPEGQDALRAAREPQ